MAIHTTDAALYGDRVRVSSESAFASAVRNGNGYAGTVRFYMDAGQSVSIDTIHNANTVIRGVEADGLEVSYCFGDTSGQLLQLGSGRSLNAIIGDRHKYAIEVYDSAVDGEQLLTKQNLISDPFFVDGGAVIGLKNSGEAGWFSASIAFEALGPGVEPFMLYSQTSLESGTEMGDFNGAS